MRMASQSRAKLGRPIWLFNVGQANVVQSARPSHAPSLKQGTKYSFSSLAQLWLHMGFNQTHPKKPTHITLLESDAKTSP